MVSGSCLWQGRIHNGCASTHDTSNVRMAKRKDAAEMKGMITLAFQAPIFNDFLLKISKPRSEINIKPLTSLRSLWEALQTKHARWATSTGHGGALSKTSKDAIKLAVKENSTFFWKINSYSNHFEVVLCDVYKRLVVASSVLRIFDELAGAESENWAILKLSQWTDSLRSSVNMNVLMIDAWHDDAPKKKEKNL